MNQVDLIVLKNWFETHGYLTFFIASVKKKEFRKNKLENLKKFDKHWKITFDDWEEILECLHNPREYIFMIIPNFKHKISDEYYYLLVPHLGRLGQGKAVRII